MSGGSVTFSTINFTVNTGTAEKLLVTADIAAAGASTEGNSIGSSINAGGDVVLTSPDVVSISTPLNGNTHTITDSGDTDGILPQAVASQKGSSKRQNAPRGLSFEGRSI